MLAENLASAASLSRLSGDDDDALALAREALDVAASIGNLWGQAYAAMNAYEIHLDRGEVGTAVTMMREAIDMGERAGFLAAQATSRATLAETYAYLGDSDLARDTAAIALEIANERLPMARPWVLGGIAQIHLWAGELDDAEAALAGFAVELLPEPLRSAASIKVPLVRGSRRRREGRPLASDRDRRRRPRPFAPCGPPAVRRGGHVAEGAGARRRRQDARRRRDPAGSAPDGRRPRAPPDHVGVSSWRSRPWPASESARGW